MVLSHERKSVAASAPPTESDANIVRAFEAGWGGVVTKTIGMHPVTNVKGPKTKFLRVDNGDVRLWRRRETYEDLMQCDAEA